MEFPHGVPIVVITRVKTGTNDHGNPVYDETRSAPILGAFDPAIGFESTQGRDQIVTQPQAYLPPSAVVTSASALLIEDERYEVDGKAANWKHPLTGEHFGWQVPLKQATG